MKYAKIIVKSEYEKRGDLVLRPYVRALKKIFPISKLLLDGDNSYIYGIIDDNNMFYEVFTKRMIDYEDYTLVSEDEFMLATIRGKDKPLFEAIMEKILFDENIELGFEVSSMEDLSKDRQIEFDAYDKFLSRVNPYQRLNNGEVENCNDFLHKLEEIKKMKKNDRLRIERDEYEVAAYMKRPEIPEDDEYSIFKKPKTLRK